MRTLVIGDLHHHTETADAIRAAEPHEHVVFLGDYFDDFYDSPLVAAQTALWLKERMAEGRSTLLFGNHDLPYAFDTTNFSFLACSGFTRDKQKEVAKVLQPADWEVFRGSARVGPWLVSHAGFHRELLPAALLRDPAGLEARCAQAVAELRQQRPDSLFAAGRDRGGWAPVGGITWGDWEKFEGVEGVHQIVGHTPSRKHPLREWTTPQSNNYCIDFLNGRTYAVVEDAQTTFKRYHPDAEATILDEIPHSRLAQL